MKMIVCVDANYGIGDNEGMAWHMPAELKLFKSLTEGKTVVMGRKTFETLGSNPLPNRKNVVLTRNKDYSADGVTTVNSIEEVMALDGEVIIIGGADVYGLFSDKVERAYVSKLHTAYICTTFFPEAGELIRRCKPEGITEYPQFTFYDIDLSNK